MFVFSVGVLLILLVCCVVRGCWFCCWFGVISRDLELLLVGLVVLVVGGCLGCG